jgi:hypothetical protein
MNEIRGFATDAMAKFAAKNKKNRTGSTLVFVRLSNKWLRRIDWKIKFSEYRWRYKK